MTKTTRMIDALRDDRGVAMVTAIMASLVVLALSVVGFQLATHNLDQSAGHRRGVQSVHSAEAGLDRFLDYLANTAVIESPACRYPLAGSQESMVTGSDTTFSVTAEYYATADGTGTALGSAATCPSPFASIPKSVIITSSGTSAGKSRTMQTLVELVPNPGSSLASAAVYANGSATWAGQATISMAAGSVLPANLYSNSDLELKGGGSVHGDVEAQGFIKLSGSTDVKQDVTARGSLTVTNKAIVRGHGRSSQSSVSNSGTIQANAYYCTGAAPGGTVGGSRISECKPSAPVSHPFKTFTYEPTAWSDPSRDSSYNTTNSFTSCSDASSFLSAIPTGNYVVRINSTCSLTIPNMVMKGHLAIISNGDITGTGSTSITRSGSSPTWTLHLMSNILNAPATVGGPTCANNAGITLAAGISFPPEVDVLFYTACDVRFTGNATASVQGQIIAGGNVTFSSGSNITYKPIIVAGTNPVGFRQSVRHRSEITN